MAPDSLGTKILVQVPADRAVGIVLDGKDDLLSAERTFPEWVGYFADNYLNNRRMIPVIKAANCSKCEFTATPEQEKAGC